MDNDDVYLRRSRAEFLESLANAFARYPWASLVWSLDGVHIKFHDDSRDTILIGTRAEQIKRNAMAAAGELRKQNNG